MKLSRKYLIVGLIGIVAIVGVSVLVKQNKARTLDVAVEARKALAERRFDDARKLIDKWSSISLRSGECEFVKAQLEAALDHPVETVAAMKKAGEYGYDEASLNIMANVLKARAGQLQVAEPVLSSAFDIGMEPRGLVAEAMARIFLSTYRMTDASRALDRWMEADPNDARPYLWRNEIDERMGAEPPELIRNYRTALKLDPNLDKARLGLAEILLKFHRNDEAEVEFAAYIARNPESNAGHIGLGQIAVLRGDLTTATREFVDVLKRDPKNLSALQELALIEMRSNKAEAAAARLKKAIDIAPYDVGLHYDYARALKLSGNEAKAAEETATTNRLRKESEQITKMRNELVNRPDDDELKADVVGWLIEHGQEQEALKWSELILARKPTHSKTCAILTKYYERIGNAGLANYYRTFAGNGAK